MSKTADLRKLVTTQLNLVPGETYYRRASATAVPPYKTFDLSRIDLSDLSRDDYELTVDVWDHSDDPKDVDAIADDLEDQLCASNLPQSTILPTFFRENRMPVKDPDKDIQHVQLTFMVQLYKA